ncbi:pyridoxamine 5'-phosphate oxidase family protein [Natronomonas sp. EA1]|uniref:pyridoxamine 5'-phosphate oxidase family protein n=1 Tax=Natronomonas sp. EA1 TaxID=3421655 RepID=UPI003EBDA71A
MSTTSTTELDATARDAFLGTGGTGVIAFAGAAGAPPHSLPVSYGYDATAETFYFRLALGSDHEKAPLVERPVSFVVYGTGEDGWRSVIATGHLEPTTDEAIATETLAGLERVDIPFVEMFGEPPRDLEFGFFRLVPESLTAQTESAAPL